MGKIVLAIAVTCGLIFGMTGLKASFNPAYQQVTVTTAAVSDITGSIVCNGKIESMSENNIYTDTAMRVTSVDISVGDHVTAGQLLFTAEAVSDPLTETDQGIRRVLGSEWSRDEVVSVFNAILEGNAHTFGTASYFGAENEKYTVLSPIDGIVTEVNIEPDTVYGTAVSCMTVLDPQQLAVHAAVSESLIRDVQTGMDCIITGNGFEGTFRGTVVSIAPYARQLQSLTGAGETVVDVTIALDQVSDKLMPGFTVNVDLVTETIDDAILIPYECIRQDEKNGEYVYVVMNGVVHRRYIDTGYELEDRAQVVSGLLAGEYVIVSPDPTLTIGEKVEVVHDADL